MTPPKPLLVPARFESAYFRLSLPPSPLSDCRVWVGSRNGQGYGVYSSRLAHRLAYAMFKGPIPDGMLVCHSCDNPACVNPDHLRTDTHAGNMRDVVLRKRIPRKPPRTPSPMAMKAIEMAKSGATSGEICNATGLGYSNVRHIKAGRVWNDFSGFKKS